MASIFKQKYTGKDKDGNKITKQSKNWYIDYKTADDTRKRIKGFKDKTATTQYAAKLEREVELEKAGIIDKYKDHRKKPLTLHLEEYKQFLIDNGSTDKHAKMTYQRAKAIIDNCKLAFIADVRPSLILNESR